MALTEKTILDQIEITSSNHIQVRKINLILRDEGLETESIVSQEYFRETIDPNDIDRAEEILGDKLIIAKAAWGMIGE